MHDLEHCPFTRRGSLVTAGLGVRASAASGATGPAHQVARTPPCKVVQEGGGQTTYLLVFDKGAEVLSGLVAFARVVEDGNWLSSRQPSDLPAFNRRQALHATMIWRR